MLITFQSMNRRARVWRNSLVWVQDLELISVYFQYRSWSCWLWWICFDQWEIIVVSSSNPISEEQEHHLVEFMAVLAAALLQERPRPVTTRRGAVTSVLSPTSGEAERELGGTPGHSHSGHLTGLIWQYSRASCSHQLQTIVKSSAQTIVLNFVWCIQIVSCICISK